MEKNEKLSLQFKDKTADFQPDLYCCRKYMYINNVCCFSPCYLHQDLLVHLDTLYSYSQRVGGAKIKSALLLLLLFFLSKAQNSFQLYWFFFFRVAQIHFFTHFY